MTICYRHQRWYPVRDQFLIAFGYCGWAPGQLEREIAQHVWVVASADPKLIFDDDRGSLSQETLARRLQPL